MTALAGTLIFAEMIVTLVAMTRAAKMFDVMTFAVTIAMSGEMSGEKSVMKIAFPDGSISDETKTIGKILAVTSSCLMLPRWVLDFLLSQ
eukprot:m.109120 g.109120  ORF g.109120 m.109120 type:complete len:90 (-) comp51759_c0_seq11:943-1212(-)